jgi:hypothetical protein
LLVELRQLKDSRQQTCKAPAFGRPEGGRFGHSALILGKSYEIRGAPAGVEG